MITLLCHGVNTQIDDWTAVMLPGRSCRSRQSRHLVLWVMKHYECIFILFISVQQDQWKFIPLQHKSAFSIEEWHLYIWRQFTQQRKLDFQFVYCIQPKCAEYLIYKLHSVCKFSHLKFPLQKVFSQVTDWVVSIDSKDVRGCVQDLCIGLPVPVTESDILI